MVIYKSTKKKVDKLMRIYYLKHGINNIQRGGGKKYEEKYMDKTFELYVRKTKELYEIHVYPNPADCGIIFIDRESGIGELHSIGGSTKCAKEGLDKKGAGRFQINFLLNYLRDNKEKYGIKKLVLTDNSSIKCRGKSIKLADMYMFTRGDTWYGTFGFRPNSKDSALRYNYNKEKLGKLKANEIDMKNVIKKSYKNPIENGKEYIKERSKEIRKRFKTERLFIEVMREMMEDDCMIYYYLQNELYLEIGYFIQYGGEFLLKI